MAHFLTERWKNCMRPLLRTTLLDISCFESIVPSSISKPSDVSILIHALLRLMNFEASSLQIPGSVELFESSPFLLGRLICLVFSLADQLTFNFNSHLLNPQSLSEILILFLPSSVKKSGTIPSHRLVAKILPSPSNCSASPQLNKIESFWVDDHDQPEHASPTERVESDLIVFGNARVFLVVVLHQIWLAGSFFLLRKTEQACLDYSHHIQFGLKAFNEEHERHCTRHSIKVAWYIV